MNYQEAERLYNTARNKEKGKPIHNNTRLFKREDNFIIRFWNTDIITITPGNTYVLKNDGFFTKTTKDRLNEFSKARVIQSQYKWYIKGELFFDGITVDWFGDVLNPMKNSLVEKLDRKQKKLDKKVNIYIDKFIKYINSGKLEYPSGGDCWYCSLKDGFGITMGDNFNNVSHLVEHMKQNYFVPSLLFNAIKEKGYGKPEFVFERIKTGEFWNTKRILKDYFRKRNKQLLEII